MKNYKMDYVEVISLVITITIMTVIIIMEKNDVSVRLAWNDLSRISDDDAIMTKLLTYVTSMVLAISTWVIGIVKKETH